MSDSDTRARPSEALLERAPGRAPPPVPPRPHRHRRRRGPRTFVAVVLALFGVGAAWYFGVLPRSLDVTQSLRDTSSVGGATAAPPGDTAGGTRVLPTVAAPTASTSYRFLQTQPGSTEPVTWSPCRTVHFVVRRPVTAQEHALITAAFREVSAHTGLAFQDDGWTDEAPARVRAAYQPGRYGARWAPVLVALSDSDELPALTGAEVGIAAPTSWGSRDGPKRYVSGFVVLDRPQLRRAGDEVGLGPRAVRDAVLHELGHLVGLDHVDDAQQLMNPTLTLPLEGFSDGDLAGLARLGAGSCAP